MSGPDESYMGFVGVSTASSSIMKVFPLWADALGLPTRRLVGHDLPLGAPAARYRKLVETIRDDPNHRGALVTTHKMAIFDAARDLFDNLDDLALRFGEVSSIDKTSGRLKGSAKDPVTARLALREFLPPTHFSDTDAAAVVLGAGGAGNALSYELGTRTDRPSRIHIVAIDEQSLRHARALHERGGVPDGLVNYLLTDDPVEVDRLIETLPSRSLVVNGTGMGKDRPGSPTTDAVVFPEHSFVWEFNYRGSLEFLHLARAQQTARNLTIEDGWRYFIHGWTQVIAQVFDIPMPPARIDQLSVLAESVR